MSLGRTLTCAVMEVAGVDEETALTLVQRIIEWGGENNCVGREFYWPASYRRFTVAERNAAIRSEFNGRNLRDLCERYDVSHQTIYRIVRRNESPGE